MRLPTAKYLARASADLKLATVHEALARALGYRDWYELSITTQPNGLAAPDLEEALRVILELADALGLPDSHVQYSVSKARLLRATLWSIDEHMFLRASIWRRRVFGTEGRGKPGTVVRDRASGSASPSSPLPDFVPSRIWLPYGLWQLRDGSEVAFSRDYLPMWRISNDRTERLAPWLWIKDIAEEKYFASPGTAIWASGPARDGAVVYLQRHRIFELPILTDIMPHLFEPGSTPCRTVLPAFMRRDALRRLRHATPSSIIVFDVILSLLRSRTALLTRIC